MIHLKRLLLPILLLLCLLDMPYGYYMLVRLVAAAFFCFMAFNFYQNKKIEQALFWFALVILFQPLIKIPLGRDLWNIVDCIVAIILVVVLYRKTPNVGG